MKEPKQLDLGLGRKRRDRGAKQRQMKDPTFFLFMFGEVEKLALSGEEFTADDVRLRCDAAGMTPTHPNSRGSVFLSALKRKPPLIERVGDSHSRVPSNHACYLPVYRGVRS